MPVNKVVYGGTTLIDISSDTVTASTLLNGYTSHRADGTKITGTFVPLDINLVALAFGLTEAVLLENADEPGLSSTMTSSDDDLTHTTVFTNSSGTEVARTVKVYSNDGLTITTTDNIGRRTVETINSEMTQSVIVLTDSSGNQLGTLTKVFTPNGRVSATMFTFA